MLFVLQRLFIREAGNSRITTGALKNDRFLWKTAYKPSWRSVSKMHCSTAGFKVLLYWSVCRHDTVIKGFTFRDLFLESEKNTSMWLYLLLVSNLCCTAKASFLFFTSAHSIILSALVLFVHCELLRKVLLLSELSAGPQVPLVLQSPQDVQSFWNITIELLTHITDFPQIESPKTFCTVDCQVCPSCSRIRHLKINLSSSPCFK